MADRNTPHIWYRTVVGYVGTGRGKQPVEALILVAEDDNDNSRHVAEVPLGTPTGTLVTIANVLDVALAEDPFHIEN